MSRDTPPKPGGFAPAITEPTAKSPDTLAELRECCARDLRHAIDRIPDKDPFREMFIDRQKHYFTVFADTAEYRFKLHIEMDNMERDNQRLRAENTRLERELKTASGLLLIDLLDHDDIGDEPDCEVTPF